MRLLSTRLQGPLLLERDVFADDRGFFLETYSREQYRRVGIDVDFVQDNHSRSRRGTVRALHFQTVPGQPKLVYVVHGRIYDVVVDLRRRSSTFGEWESFELDDAGHRQLYVPIGFAHGFCALTDEVDVVYKVGSYYNAATERGIAWDDPDIGIPWPVRDPELSRRDRSNPTLRAVADDLPEW